MHCENLGDNLFPEDVICVELVEQLFCVELVEQLLFIGIMDGERAFVVAMGPVHVVRVVDVEVGGPSPFGSRKCWARRIDGIIWWTARDWNGVRHVRRDWILHCLIELGKDGRKVEFIAVSHGRLKRFDGGWNDRSGRK